MEISTVLWLAVFLDLLIFFFFCAPLNFSPWKSLSPIKNSINTGIQIRVYDIIPQPFEFFHLRHVTRFRRSYSSFSRLFVRHSDFYLSCLIFFPHYYMLVNWLFLFYVNGRVFKICLQSNKHKDLFFFVFYLKKICSMQIHCAKMVIRLKRWVKINNKCHIACRNSIYSFFYSRQWLVIVHFAGKLISISCSITLKANIKVMKYK